jgi:uracil-DNA glycosylase
VSLRDELRALLRAARGLAEYGREGTPEGIYPADPAEIARLKARPPAPPAPSGETSHAQSERPAEAREPRAASADPGHPARQGEISRGADPGGEARSLSPEPPRGRPAEPRREEAGAGISARGAEPRREEGAARGADPGPAARPKPMTDLFGAPVAPPKWAQEAAKKAPEPPKKDPPLPKEGGRLVKARLPEFDPEDKAKREEELARVRDEALACTACRLCEKRNRVVFGVGPVFAPIMFVGEGPGEQEDLSGIPFVGAAGQLLTKIITATGFARADVAIANCVKCRPPGNRNPEPDELEACRHFLEKQVEIVSPRVIVTLGKFAAQTLLNTKASMTALRGGLKSYRGIPLMPTFHPAYLLRNPEAKRLVWDDMQKVRRAYEEIIDKR